MRDRAARLRFGAFVAIVSVALVAWFALSPYIVVWQLQNAVRSGDIHALSELVDFPSLRDNVNGSLAATPAGASLGAGIATLLAGPIVDAMLTPSGVATMLRTEATTSNDRASPEPPLTVEMRYVSIDRFAVAFGVARAHARVEGRLCRARFFTWRLCALSAPFL